jgi:hypothetical protein
MLDGPGGRGMRPSSWLHDNARTATEPPNRSACPGDEGYRAEQGRAQAVRILARLTNYIHLVD